MTTGHYKSCQQELLLGHVRNRACAAERVKQEKQPVQCYAPNQRDDNDDGTTAPPIQPDLLR